jgi:monoterpene epsilon-lactone hydrolase
MTDLVIHHAAEPADQAMVAAIRAQSAPFKGMMSGIEARPGYDDMIAAIPGAEGVTYVAASLGGVPGHWCRPAKASAAGQAILYLHGGAYVLGSATAYRNFAGQFAARTGVPVFVADYGLSPERPFPQGLHDARAVWQAMQTEGFSKLAIVGDSAGGGLSLSLLAWARAEAAAGRGMAPQAAAVMSPWIDLALTGASHQTRAEEDPFITANMMQTCAALYLGQTDPRAPEASAVYGNLTGLPPIQIHVGTAEVLLDDSRTYAAAVHAAGGAVEAHVWQDMPHVFPSSFGMLKAGEAAMGLMAGFLRQHLNG